MTSSADHDRVMTPVPVEHATGGGERVTYFALDSGVEGPVVTILSGVHGNELTGILALRGLINAGLPLRRGAVRMLPVANPPAHAADSRVTPEDGKNLARVFPGATDGTVTEQLADLITREIITGSDLLVDLHTSSPDADLPFFAGCVDDGSLHSAVALELCHAFGAGVVWTHAALGPGRTLSIAHELRIPALYVESPRGGVVTAEMLNAYTNGVLRILARMDMIDGARLPPGEPTELLISGNGDTDAAPIAEHDGFFVPHVELLDAVLPGDLIGTLFDEKGEVLDVIRSPSEGVVTVLRTKCLTAAGDNLFEVGAIAVSRTTTRTTI